MKVDAQLAQDLVITALEGGSNYWIDDWFFSNAITLRMIRYKHGLEQWKNGRAALRVKETDHAYHRKLMVNNIIQATLEYTKNMELEYYDWDAGDADNILQMACFGEVVYG